MTTMHGATVSKTWVAGQVNFDYTSHETQLIRKAQRGDLSAFNRLVYAYQERAYRFAYRVLGDADAAGQATQQAFVLAHRHFGNLRDEPLSVWLLRFVAHACRQQHRAKQLRRSSRSIAPPGPSDASRGVPSPIGEMQALDDILQQGLATLAFEPRVILVLADMEAYSYEQIARITGMRAEAVQSRLASARRQLMQFLTAHEHRLPSQFRLTVAQPQL